MLVIISERTVHSIYLKQKAIFSVIWLEISTVPILIIIIILVYLFFYFFTENFLLFSGVFVQAML